jgi:hypothetical protein
MIALATALLADSFTVYIVNQSGKPVSITLGGKGCDVPPPAPGQGPASCELPADAFPVALQVQTGGNGAPFEIAVNPEKAFAAPGDGGTAHGACVLIGDKGFIQIAAASCAKAVLGK